MPFHKIHIGNHALYDVTYRLGTLSQLILFLSPASKTLKITNDFSKLRITKHQELVSPDQTFLFTQSFLHNPHNPTTMSSRSPITDRYRHRTNCRIYMTVYFGRSCSSIYSTFINAKKIYTILLYMNIVMKSVLVIILVSGNCCCWRKCIIWSWADGIWLSSNDAGKRTIVTSAVDMSFVADRW